MKFTPRDYQLKAIDNAIHDIFNENHRGRDGGVSLELCTGAGKTLIDLMLVKAIREKEPRSNILVMTTSVELVHQIHHAFKTMGGFKKGDLGLFVGMKKQVLPVTIGTVQSIGRSPELFQHYNAILFDEAHKGFANHDEINRRAKSLARKIANSKEERWEFTKKYGIDNGILDQETIVKILEEELQGQARSILKLNLQHNPNRISVYLSGSLWRFGQKSMIGTKEECQNGTFFISKKSFEITSKELLDMGFLKPIFTKEPHQQLDLKSVKQTSFGYDIKDLSAKFSAIDLVQHHLDEYADVALPIIEKYPLGQHLIFCTDIKHMEAMLAAFKTHPKLQSVKAKVLHHKVSKEERAAIIHGFKNGEFRTLISGDIIGTGFDMANNDPAINAKGHEINFVLGCSPSKSLSKIVQRELGRSCRPRYSHDKKYNLSTIQGRLDSIKNGPVPYTLYLSFDGHPTLFKQLNGLPLGNPEISELGHAPSKRCPVCDARVPIKALICNTTIFATQHRKDKPEEILFEGSVCTYQFPETPRGAYKKADAYDGDLFGSEFGKKFHAEKMKTNLWTGDRCSIGYALRLKNGNNLGRAQSMPEIHIGKTVRNSQFLAIDFLCTHSSKGIVKVRIIAWNRAEVPSIWKLIAPDPSVARPQSFEDLKQSIENGHIRNDWIEYSEKAEFKRFKFIRFIDPTAEESSLTPDNN